nr:flagellar filament capping protein FliD [Planctomycetota bacterium]
AKYAADGKAVSLGTFQITDSSGTVSSISVGSDTRTLGDVIDKINAAGVQVTARLNDTGDGLVLIDEAGGTGSLTVTNLGTAKTATALKIAGTGIVGGDGKLRIDGRQSVQITLDADDTLSDLEVKLRSANAGLTATIFNDGSPANPNRLLLSGTKSGTVNRLRIDDGGIGLGLSTVVAAQDALLRVGNDPATGVLLASETNSFKNVPGGLDIDLLQAGTGPIEVTVGRDLAAVKNAVKQFVTTYNQYYDTAGELTKFDPATNQRGILQGDGTVSRVRTRLDGLLSGRYGTDSSLSSLADLGVTFGPTGKLVLDEEKLAQVLNEKPDAAKGFFSDRTKGFGVKSKAVLDSLTDPFTGSFKLQDDALTDSITRIEQRVDQLDAILLSRRDRLIRQFAKMEEVLNGLQSQQTALVQLANLAVSNRK